MFVEVLRGLVSGRGFSVSFESGGLKWKGKIEGTHIH